MTFLILSKDDVKLFLRKQSLKNQEDFTYDQINRKRP